MNSVPGASGSQFPLNIPRDLWLIQQIVGGNPQASTILKRSDNDEDVKSSGSECDSQDEIEAQLLLKTEDDHQDIVWSSPGGSSPDTSSDSDSASSPESDSDSEQDNSGTSSQKKPSVKLDDDHDLVDDLEHDSVPACTYQQTKNEIAVKIVIPDIEEVGVEEVLEKVGEIMSIVDTVVIVQGMITENSNMASNRALDSDTLLVFEDRKVLGYVFETFGPTSQPFYQVRFNEDYPLDPVKIWLSREVFHVPRRSRFVFVEELKNLRGTDASILHDEEPGDDEVEFSDDEQEAAYKKRRKIPGMSHASSSRLSTPIHSHMRDQDLNNDDSYLEPGTNPYGAYGPYDMDFTTSVTRPPPIPCDDPYSDAYGLETASPTSFGSSSTLKETPRRPISSGKVRGREWPFREQHSVETPTRRGRGRGRGRGGRGRGHSNTNSLDQTGGHYSDLLSSPARPSPRVHTRQPSRQMSPTSFAIARATGQQSEQSVPHTPVGNDWRNSQQQFLYTSPYHQTFNPQSFPTPYVQPHINPRFASAFGFGVGQSPVAAHSFPQLVVDESPSVYRWSTYESADDKVHGPDSL